MGGTECAVFYQVWHLFDEDGLKPVSSFNDS